MAEIEEEEEKWKERWRGRRGGHGREGDMEEEGT